MTELTRIMYPVTGERLVIDASQFAKPDPRDERIAELETWIDIKQATAEGLALVARGFEQDVQTANSRIAELEAALRKVRTLAGEATTTPDGYSTPFDAGVRHISYIVTIYDTAASALMYEPERSMEVADEELGY